MKTIEDIKVDKEFVRVETDENGNKTKVPYTKEVKRHPILVERGTRFGYYLIDLVFIYILAFIIGVLSAFSDSVTIWDDPIFSRLFGAMIVVSYYFILESTTGSTLGKMILGYTVIDKYAEKPKIGSLLGRSFARIVPFEAFSCFSDRGWHDTWSGTYVVKNSEKIELQKYLGKINDKTDLLD
jgi:uncharacterized RDD family membrane protein YckC